MSIKPGVRLGDRYQLLTLIATGGMGQVWRAEDTTLHRVVAAKVLRSEYTGDATFLARFRAEAQNTAALSHPNVASVYDYGETVQDAERLAYLVMELVDGEPLVEILHRERRLPPARTLDILQQAATGLDAAHRAGMVHRDIKPGNLIIRPDGVVKITDFGIARAANNVPLTDSGTVVGTAQYLAPEQAEGRPAIPGSDVYALGVVGYECLAGFRPFDGENSVAIALSQIRDAPRPLPMDVAPTIRELINRSMAKNPRIRFANGGSFAAAIAIVRSGGSLAPPAGPGLAPSSTTISIPQLAVPQGGINPSSHTMAGAPVPQLNQPPRNVQPPGVHPGGGPPPNPATGVGPPTNSPGMPTSAGSAGGGGPMQGGVPTGLVPPQSMPPGQAATGQYNHHPAGATPTATGSSRRWLLVGGVIAAIALLALVIFLLVRDNRNDAYGAGTYEPAPTRSSAQWVTGHGAPPSGIFTAGWAAGDAAPSRTSSPEVGTDR